MKNKVKFKKFLVHIIIFLFIFMALFSILNYQAYRTYQKNFNGKIAMIVEALQTKYPNLSTNDIMSILNNQEYDADIFKFYGIDINNNSIIEVNDQVYKFYLVINILLILLMLLVLFFYLYKYYHKHNQELKDITKYLEEINKKNYELKIDSISEDELSIFKNEIYKTTIMLKEIAQNSYQDKINLKQSLEDISHQLKTPLTSILVMLDNLIDDESMDRKVQEEFIHDIKREVININFLVQALLKLSRFDANTITFISKENKLSQIIEETIKNVAPLCDLKNINVIVNGPKNLILKCDAKWQIEALTNILKNCVEHAFNNQDIIINVSQNNIYTSIEIIDYGEVINPKDLKHIFERFYRGVNASQESVGIGLALAKSIINKDQGTIEATSIKNKTTFLIKYMHI